MSSFELLCCLDPTNITPVHIFVYQQRSANHPVCFALVPKYSPFRLNYGSFSSFICSWMTLSIAQCTHGVAFSVMSFPLPCVPTARSFLQRVILLECPKQASSACTRPLVTTVKGSRLCRVLNRWRGVFQIVDTDTIVLSRTLTNRKYVSPTSYSPQCACSNYWVLNIANEHCKPSRVTLSVVT